MTEFTLKLKILNAGNKKIYYSIDLTGMDVSHPEDYFSSRSDRGKTNRLNLRKAIENQSLRQVNDEELSLIINEWNHGIKNGKSNSTTVTISLEPYGSNSNSVIASPNYPNTLPPIQQPLTPQKSPDYNHSPGEIAETRPESIPIPKKPISPLGEQKITPPNEKNIPPDSSPNTTPTVDTWATDNKVDF